MSDRRYEFNDVEALEPYSIPLRVASKGAELLYVIADMMRHDPYWSVDNDDSCDCTMRRVYVALDHFFQSPNDVAAAIALARDGKQHRCQGCRKRDAAHD